MPVIAAPSLSKPSSPQDFKKVFIHKDPVDLRKSINGLSEIVEQSSMDILMEPHLFVFSSRRKMQKRFCILISQDFACGNYAANGIIAR
jgi:IS66 Orf2 like protein